MDRTILESNPHRVIEGMVIGAYAIGAHQGYLYIRDEYPLVVERLAGAITQAEAHGSLGADIPGAYGSLKGLAESLAVSYLGE
jgi:NADH:ubiquinone oxidoreductase subunit F (NADH-binding)